MQKNETKIYPGPWTVRKEGGALVLDSPKWIGFAKFYIDNKHSETSLNSANAAAAAPKMIEALQEAALILGKLNSEDDIAKGFNSMAVYRLVCDVLDGLEEKV